MKKNLFYPLLIAILLITYVIYKMGLNGDYVFDDSVNILANSKLAITNLSLESLKSAYGSGDAGPLGRPISMLSFAFNHYFTGFNPYYFKLTNLFIHLINGVLICFLSLFILKWINKDKKLTDRTISIIALIVMTVWLVHPLNLTSVLYVVQRMTSLSTLFGLFSLLIYSYIRINHITSFNRILLIILIATSLIFSVLSKESGILFVLLLYWLELTIYQAKRLDGTEFRIFNIQLIKLLWVVAVLGSLILLYWVQPHFNPSSFARRDFNLEERLYTESRVIFFYLKQLIYPQLSELSLYHDDFVISKSLLNPVTTLYSVLGLFVITVASLLTFKKYPLILFAWGWYVISQLLESTAFSLELVHEHRNYFGTLGFILLVTYYLARITNKKIKPIIYVFALIYTANLAFTTWQRSAIWSNLVDHAVYEAYMHPKSDRANYQLVRIYIKLMQNSEIEAEKKKYAEEAYKYIQLSKESYLPANGAWFAKIHLDSDLKKEMDLKNVYELIDRLKNQPFHNSNVSFLSALTNCQIKQFCKLEPLETINIIAAGLENKTSNPSLNSEIYKLLAQYYVSVLGEYEKGEEFLEKALILKNDVNGHLLLSQVYRLQGKLHEAKIEILKAETLDSNGVWFKEIALEKSKQVK